MIEKVRIQGYRKFRDFILSPHRRFNILVGENEAGKSTLLEAIGLALTGRVNSRPAGEELNPYWFNQDQVREFFQARASGKKVASPIISIEIFLEDRDEFQRDLFGAHNSEIPTRECAGVFFRVVPDPDYSIEIEAHLSSDTSILPVEYYRIDWRSFGDHVLTRRPKDLATAIIDSRTIRSTSGVDLHVRQMLQDNLDPEDKATVSLAFRAVKEKMTNTHLQAVNRKMAELEGSLDDKLLSLAMDQSARGSWDASVVPHIADLPFSMAGQGQQATAKIALAMRRGASRARVVMVEEPENHLSHTSLNKLISRIADLAGTEQQFFATTHSSFVLNRLGLDGLIFLSDGQPASFGDLPSDTVDYFKKLPGYDTLRMVLADSFVLVEGPSDEILFEHFYKNARGGRRPIEDGIDIVSVGALAFRRCLELAKALSKRCVVLRDNDGQDQEAIIEGLRDLIDDDTRRIFVSDPSLGPTLEPQILAANPDEATMRRILRLTDRADLETWMRRNKTEGALRIAAAGEMIHSPSYIREAIGFISDRSK